MTNTSEQCLYATGETRILLTALGAILLHQRSHHPSYRGPEHRAQFQCRGDLCGALMDLAHNWPAVVSGENRFFTASMIADQIEAFQARHALDEDYADEHLGKALTFAARRLRAMSAASPAQRG